MCVYLGVGLFLGGERGTKSSWLTPRKSSFMEKPERGGLVAMVISSPRIDSLVACTHTHMVTTQHLFLVTEGAGMSDFPSEPG